MTDTPEQILAAHIAAAIENGTGLDSAGTTTIARAAVESLPAEVQIASTARLAALLDIERAALALARSEEQMRMALAGEDAGGLFEPWPEADALVAALRASGAEARHG